MSKPTLVRCSTSRAPITNDRVRVMDLEATAPVRRRPTSRSGTPCSTDPICVAPHHREIPLSSRASGLRSRSSGVHVWGSVFVHTARLGQHIIQPNDPFGADSGTMTIAFLVAPSSPRQANDTGWLGIALPELLQPGGAKS